MSKQKTQKETDYVDVTRLLALGPVLGWVINQLTDQYDGIYFGRSEGVIMASIGVILSLFFALIGAASRNQIVSVKTSLTGAAVWGGLGLVAMSMSPQ